MTDQLTIPFATAGADISDCGLYRYSLWRTWDPAKPPVCWCMLNPSTADGSADDPTIRRCVDFAKRWGHGGIVVVNLFAFRATDPAALARTAAPVGMRNDERIHLAVGRCPLVVAAWGCGGSLFGRDAAVRRLLAFAGADVRCLGTTKGGHPRHPLYVKASAVPVPFTLNTEP
jgi:hypothetical protein